MSDPKINADRLATFSDAVFAVIVTIMVREDGASGSWVQADRGARIAQSVFLTGDQQEAYLAGEPANDARFVGVFAHALEHTGGYAPEEARRVAGTLLPDLLPYDPTRPVRYPDNGRALSDDAGDAFLAALSNGKATDDRVGPHDDLLADFPYLGPPHKAWGLELRNDAA